MGDTLLNEIVKDNLWTECWGHDYVNFDFPEKVDKYYKISVCTNCMNRASDLKQTYIQNIEDNKSYPNVEFVLLNYNSKDDMDEWVKNNLMKYIDSGILNYYRVLDEINVYSMTHSRNISFKVALGDLVTNVDGDHFCHEGFVTRLNELGNLFPKKVVFCKSRHKNRGRLGLWKKEFIECLGGYDENLIQYGVDDIDLHARASRLGFVSVKFGGKFCSITDDHKRHQSTNYSMHWRWTQRRNTLISLLNIKLGIYKANQYQDGWGKARLIKNFDKEINI